MMILQLISSDMYQCLHAWDPREKDEEAENCLAHGWEKSFYTLCHTNTEAKSKNYNALFFRTKYRWS